MGYRWFALRPGLSLSPISIASRVFRGAKQIATASNVRLLGLLILLPLIWGFMLPLSNIALAQVSDDAATDATDRRFRQNLCIEYLSSLELPSQDFEGTAVGGLSALTYDLKTGQFYSLSDDHGSGQARIYELDIPISESDDGPQFGPATVTNIIRLTDADGQPYSGSFDPEGLALTPQDSFFVSTEGEPSQGLAPGLFEFDRSSGALLRQLPVPEKFTPVFPEPDLDEENQSPVSSVSQSELPQSQGVQSNQGFEALTISATGTAPGEPLRLFTATEGPLIQDTTAASINGQPRDRLLHYYLGEGRPLLVAEHLYPLSPLPGSVFHGLSEMLALDGEGHFLTLERALTPLGFDAKLFQITLAGASDISSQESLRGTLVDTQPIQKQLLLHLNELGIGLDNLEGMSWGPRLKDGSRSLLLISDDNFKSFQKTQILLFKLSQD